jgi:hypothetical protein
VALAVVSSWGAAASGCGRVGYDEHLVVRDAGLDADVPPPGANPCDRFQRLGVEPTIDGAREPALGVASWTPAGWTGAEPLPDGHAAVFAAAARPDGVLFYVRVTTPRPLRPPAATADTFCGDAVEVFVDADGRFDAPPAYDDPGTLQVIVPAPEEGAASSARHATYRDGRLQAPLEAAQVAAVRTADGFAVEVFVRLADLGVTGRTLGPGDRVALAFSVDIAREADGPGPCGRRLGQYYERIAPPPVAPPCFGRPHCDVRALCATMLVGATL